MTITHTHTKISGMATTSTDGTEIQESLQKPDANLIFDKLGDWDVARVLLLALADAENQAREKGDPRESKFSEMNEMIGTAYGMRRV